MLRDMMAGMTGRGAVPTDDTKRGGKVAQRVSNQVRIRVNQSQFFFVDDINCSRLTG